MAGESSARFHSHRHHQPGLVFNPTNNNNAISSGCELISLGNYYNTHVGSGDLNSLESPQTSPGLKHDTGLAVEWSVEEQYKLDEGLAKYANEPNIMRYIKIAASLHDKTVRDVALRCRWMTRKRRKQDDLGSAKRAKDQKDKFSDSSLMNMSSPLSIPVVSYSLTKNHHDQEDYVLSGAISVLSGAFRHLLEENNHALSQISANLSTLKLQQNIDLFLRTRNNLNTILNDMKITPGIMSQMPPLPVFLNDELTNCIIPRSSQPMMFGSSSTVPLKQEPGC